MIYTAVPVVALPREAQFKAWTSFLECCTIAQYIQVLHIIFKNCLKHKSTLSDRMAHYAHLLNFTHFERANQATLQWKTENLHSKLDKHLWNS